NPTPIRSTIGPVFFTGHSIPRAGALKLCTDEFLSGAVSIRNRCEIWSCGDFSVNGLEAVHGQTIYGVGDHQRQVEIFPVALAGGAELHACWLSAGLSRSPRC